MADRVYPNDSPPRSSTTATGTYVIHIPKDQVYRVPPPENAAKYKNLTRQYHKRRRCSPCCCCLCWLLGVVLSLIVLIAIAAGIFYLVFRPESPNYSIDNISIKGLNISTTPTSQSLTVSPEINVTVRAANPNHKMGIFYEPRSQIEVSYTNISLAKGSLPVFFQPTNNVTVFHTLVKGGRLVLSRHFHKQLVEDQRKENVPLRLKMRVPVKIKVGSVKTWRITVKVSCDLTVDKLMGRPKIVKKDCNYGVDLW